MITSNNTITCPAGTAIEVTFIFTVSESAMIQADCPDQQFAPNFKLRSRTLDGCYKPLKGLAITLAKDGQFVQAFILQSEYENHFSESIQAEIDSAIQNPDR